MILYSAGIYSHNMRVGAESALFERLSDKEKEIFMSVDDLLESYHYVHKQKFVDAMRKDGARVFVDSGAFSAHTLGIEIKISDYCEYLLKNKDIIRHEDGVMIASVLDGIGDPLQTWRNQLEMERRGVTPLPCFHKYEDERYLEWYISKYPYITIGGMVGTSSKELIKWLDRIWDKYLLDGSGNPKLKVHAFGITAIPIMERYPWYSVDSSSWTQYAAFGYIFTPKWGQISISDKSTKVHNQGQHVKTLTHLEQDAIYKHLEDTGFTYERLATIYESRAAYNVWSLGVVKETINAMVKKNKNFIQELF